MSQVTLNSALPIWALEDNYGEIVDTIFAALAVIDLRHWFLNRNVEFGWRCPKGSPFFLASPSLFPQFKHSCYKFKHSFSYHWVAASFITSLPKPPAVISKTLNIKFLLILKTFVFQSGKQGFSELVSKQRSRVAPKTVPIIASSQAQQWAILSGMSFWNMPLSVSLHVESCVPRYEMKKENNSHKFHCYLFHIPSYTVWLLVLPPQHPFNPFGTSKFPLRKKQLSLLSSHVIQVILVVGVGTTSR